MVEMSLDKEFLTYNQQMRKLRNDKTISCSGSKDKKILVKIGYFNLVNGYKEPFVCGTDQNGKHIYLPDTSLSQLYALKKFDSDLSILLLKYITQIEEEVRTLTGYKLDQCNDNGKIPWYEMEAYSPNKSLKNKMKLIASIYKELNSSRSEYVKFYMQNHDTIPTWIMIKVVKFSTLIDILNNSKTDVSHALCELYSLKGEDGYYYPKLLIGSLHWMRKVRNACAHNERVYCMQQNKTDKNKSDGRIFEGYLKQMRSSYNKVQEKRILDLLIYFKYYLSDDDYKNVIDDIKNMLTELQNNISKNAFDNVRGKMGIKDLNDLDLLKNMQKDTVNYNKFELY